MIRRSAVAIGAIGVLASCGEDPVAPRPAPPVLEITLSDSFIGPREQTAIRVAVTPTQDDPILKAWLRLESAGERDSVALSLYGYHAQSVVLDLTVPNEPISAVLKITAIVHPRRGDRTEAAVTLAIGDTVPPNVRFVSLGDTVYPGRTVSVNASYDDRSGIARHELHLTGAMVRSEVFDRPDYPTDAGIGFQIVVPDSPGDSLVQRAIGVDMYGLRREIRQVWYIGRAP